MSRESGVTAATLSSWREAFEAAGEAALKSRERDEAILRLKAKIEKLEQTHPFPWRKSKP